MANDWLDQIQWTSDGLVPVIAQDVANGRVLMLAWMNRESLALSVAKGEAVYWSRSRQRLWHKGESSGHVQRIKDIRIDCDQDVILMQVEQQGEIACHTGRYSCFYQQLQSQLSGNQWVAIEPVIKDPESIYK